MQSRALIGYLVGFEASTIWRVWICEQSRIVRVRDVVLDENEKFDPATTPLTSTLSMRLAERIETIELPESTLSKALSDEDENRPLRHDNVGRVKDRPEQSLSAAPHQPRYPTPRPSEDFSVDTATPLD